MEDRRLYFLREAVETLAMSPAEQVGVLKAGQMPVEELAEMFNDIHVVVPAMRNEGLPISDEAVEALRRVDSLLHAMSGRRHADLWVESALAADARWSGVREAAAEALRLLPET